MVWMPSRCPVCGSDLRSPRSLCQNHDNTGMPCHGLSDEDAALAAAARAYQRDECTLEEYELRVESALSCPPKRKFYMISVLR